MRRVIFGLLLVCAAPALGFQYWNDVRYSAVLPDLSVEIRVENPSGAGIENYLLYDMGGMQEMPMAPLADGPSTVAGRALGPITGDSYYGFRLLQGGEISRRRVFLSGVSALSIFHPVRLVPSFFLISSQLFSPFPFIFTRLKPPLNTRPLSDMTIFPVLRASTGSSPPVSS